MKRLVAVCIIILSVTMAFATEPKAAKKASSAQIEGTIVDFATGEALAGVALTIKDNGLKTYTDLDGKFQITGIENGTYSIDVNYVSYKSVTLKNIQASKSEVKVKVELEPATGEAL